MRHRLMQEAEIAQARHVVGEGLTERVRAEFDLSTGAGTMKVEELPDLINAEFVGSYDPTVDDTSALAHMLGIK